MREKKDRGRGEREIEKGENTAAATFLKVINLV